MLAVKFATGFVAIPILLVLLYLGGWPLFAVALIVMLVGLHEFYSALLPRGIIPVQEVGWLGAIGILAATQWAPRDWRSGIVTGCMAGVVFMALIAQFWRRRGTSVIANAGATVFGVVYVALLFSYFLRLRLLPLHSLPSIEPGSILDEMGAVVLVLAAVWMMDTLANVVGRYFGTRKPWPKISPNKTWEGSLAGLLASMVTTLLLGQVCHIPALHLLVLGIGLGAIGQIGDFCESLLKRDLGLKDFGAIIPGHGGVLDRFDSLLFAMPAAYYYLTLVVLRQY
jgi:phosphatidate cytidylyltransferase